MRQPNSFPVSIGERFPPGAKLSPQGVNFCVFSRHATAIELLLYQRPDSSHPFQIIALDPEHHRTFFWWHVLVEGLPAGICYTWRADGPFEPRGSGYRFNRRRELVDPWAKGVYDRLWNRAETCRANAPPHRSIRAVVTHYGDYDWEGDDPLIVPAEQMILYELHIGGFTRHPSAGVKNPGTFQGLIEKIAYLKYLGITHVELMPVMAFDEQDVPQGAAERGLGNFWGYSTHSFFAPHPGYCTGDGDNDPVRSFRDMVKALHRAGIGVILDVVFNHTAEGGADGPTINFRGLGNETFYHLDPLDRSRYLDFTGCGNSVQANHPVVVDFIMDCLKYWVREMHVDGFRFDLASALSRGENGQPMHNAPLVWAIELSNFLQNTTIIAEAWDAAGLYQVGAFPGFRWMEWNGRYRDVMRRFVRGDPNLLGEVATRLSGSSDLYQGNGRLPTNSINFITCHDGFTLADLVSYTQKHNEDNGEDNRDGSNDNLSWNGGVEGPADDSALLALRHRQARNFMAILLLSQGIPMLLAGDEVLRSQNGNNNAWCQNNDMGWFDWRLVEENAGMLRFVALMIAFRRRHPTLMRRRFLRGKLSPFSSWPDIVWRSERLSPPDWKDPTSRVLAFTLSRYEAEEPDLHVMLNMSESDRWCSIPAQMERCWRRAVDTSLETPADILEPPGQPIIKDPRYRCRARSVVVLEGHLI
ncbi:MAG: glycogen debranching protein GlgX [Pseudomonadota bacterium]